MPPRFVGQGESDNGDGQLYYNLGSEQGLAVWGGHLLDSFEQEVADRLAHASAEDWGISYQASTPHWASFSGQRDHRIFYQRMIALCDGASYAAFRLEHNIADLAQMQVVVEGQLRSLSGNLDEFVLGIAACDDDMLAGGLVAQHLDHFLNGEVVVAQADIELVEQHHIIGRIGD